MCVCQINNMYQLNEVYVLTWVYAEFNFETQIVRKSANAFLTKPPNEFSFQKKVIY